VIARKKVPVLHRFEWIFITYNTDSYMVQAVEHIFPRADQMEETMALSEPTGERERGKSRETEQGHFRSRANGGGGPLSPHSEGCHWKGALRRANIHHIVLLICIVSLRAWAPVTPLPICTPFFHTWLTL
jgi:hypothetical protein